MKMYYTLVPAQVAELRNHVELVLFNGGYAGLQLVESERAVLCILLPASRLRDVRRALGPPDAITYWRVAASGRAARRCRLRC